MFFTCCCKNAMGSGDPNIKMSDDDDDDDDDDEVEVYNYNFRVYNFQGNEGEEVPFAVKKLIVDEGVQELPKRLCLFNRSLQTIKLPLSVNAVGQNAFHDCSALVEANLSTTGITEIRSHAFDSCSLMQTVSLPRTLEWIDHFAFQECVELVTVVVPLDSKAIRIRSFSFSCCPMLANFVLPKGSTALGTSFNGCGLLEERYGNQSSRIVAGLIGRFENLPLHRICYDHSGTTTTCTVEELRQRITDQQAGSSPLFDEFDMSPFHVLLSTIEPRVELLDVLLDSFPYHILKWKDTNDMRPLDYLINNWTDGTVSLVQRTFQKSMIDPLSRWGTRSWMEAMQSKMEEILVEDGKEQRTVMCDEAYSLLEHYENVEATSILDMALWKCKLQSGWTSDGGATRLARDREKSRCLSGSDVVIPPIASFLGIGRTSD